MAGGVFKFLPYCIDFISKKQEILDSIANLHNLTPTSILFVGFSSFIFANLNADITVTDISPAAQEYIKAEKVKFTYVDRADLANYHKKFQVVVAVDEFFTYADSDQNQKDIVEEICNLATDYVITTLRDYKNQDYKDREFSQPSLVRADDTSLVFLESHIWHPMDRAQWDTVIYAINQSANSLTTFGKFERRTMYFKQLANFTSVAGATGFLVHKNLMYKGLVKKNYEHVITIQFN